MPTVRGRLRSQPAAPLWLGYLALCAVAMAVYFSLSGPAQAICWEAIGASSSIAVLIGVQRNRPASPWLWRTIAIGLGMLVVADVILNLYENVFGADQPFPSWADAFFLAGNSLIIVALGLLVSRRAPEGDTGSFIDAAIIAAGAGVLSWTYFMVPYAKDPTLTLLQQLVSISYPLIDVLLLAVLARLLFIGSARSAALYFVCGSVCATMVADVIYSELVLRGQYERGNPIDAFWLLWYAGWGAAALHPSMRHLAKRGNDQPRPLTGRRLALLTAAAILVPAVGLLQWYKHEPVDIPVIAGFSGALFLLVVLRMNGLVRTLDNVRRTLEGGLRRERVLRQSATALGGAAGREAICDVAVRAATRLAGIQAPVFVALGSNQAMSVIAGPEAAGPHEIDWRRLPAEAASALAAERVAVVNAASFWPEHAAGGDQALLAPLVVQHTLIGLLVVIVDGAPRPGLEQAIETLAAQVALALERDVLAEDLHIRKGEERLRSLVQHASDLIMVIDAAATITYVGPSVERTLGFGAAEMLGASVFDFINPDDRDEARRVNLQLLAQPGATATMEVRAPNRDGEMRVIEATGTNLLHDPSVKGIVVNAHDVTAHKAAEAQLKHQAYHDSLTDLPNRARFMERVERALAMPGRRADDLAILFLDLDRFKVINDSLGHEAGDLLLTQVGRRLSSCVRPGDVVARLGGDEFTVLLTDVADALAVKSVADRLLAQFKQPVVIEGREIFASVSIGIAMSREWLCRPSDLLREADIAMYQVKRRGGAGHALFDADMGLDAMERLELETDLRRAIEHEELRIHLQPTIELATGRVTSMEALVRWQHPERGMITPAEFIPLAEETGLIAPLGQWVLSEACREAIAWERALGDGAPAVAVNLSVRQFQNPAIVEEVATTLRETGLDPRRLILELTETVVMEDAESNRATLRRMKELGVQLAIDDFGSGYSSFGYLKRFPMDILKIDRSFITGLGSDREDTEIIRTISQLGETLKMQVVAEGVETRAQVAQLQLLGCSLAQGYYFARPMPAGEALAFLAQRSLWEQNREPIAESA